METFYNLPAKVTIVTTVYNAVDTIETTILSVINQTYPNIEYVIVDGGSTDGTLNIINKYRDQIAWHISEPDKGIADGFNKGIARATGEWIGMINGDDWYTLNAVELMMERVSTADNICCGNIMLMGGNGHQRIKKSKVSWLNFGMFVMHPTCFVRREVYRQIGQYDTFFKIAMDFDMFLRMKQRGYKIKYINELVVYMRTGGASADVNKMHKEEMAVMRRHLAYPAYLISLLFKQLDIIRWKYFYRDVFNTPGQIQ
ncbi:glycosyltransferase family 2 protein [Mucilaginibacter phyllosphaerae]|uniref:Glycosyltransferase n=1 Tax=Mucilaginibacter phyllosphaerae TaxID=1812349 RepID=A0A4Y8A7X4_9SPHI|nr:glycosyltransferase family 2 protein [Mucilaginibacter phyllosphaerae]MBB3970514.1 glycosyltransferase [Mucilaginibacter phyllosphaerae]TEW64529.1 glycosyltransferase [Mucilaginibacter phyllosphaerae]GGH19251.1 glycosyl transferase [Mucilaginibacter phyllosphaerae]